MNSASGDTPRVSPGLVPELLITDPATSLDFWYVVRFSARLTTQAR